MGASHLTKVVIILLLFAQVFSWIAFTVPEWGRTYSLVPHDRLTPFTALGLWRTCTYTGPYMTPSPCESLDGSALDWFIAVQALSIFGFIGINIAFLIVVLQVFTSKCDDVTDIGFWNAIQSIVTGILYLIAVILFAVKFDFGNYGNPVQDKASELSHVWHGELSFGFRLAIVALILEIASGVLMIVDTRKNKGTSPA